jgi:hypothetical protein
MTHLLPVRVFITVGATAIAGAAVAQQGNGIFEPVISINEVMVYVIDHNSHAIWDVAMAPPTDDGDWHLLEHEAVTAQKHMH